MSKSNKHKDSPVSSKEKNSLEKYFSPTAKKRRNSDMDHTSPTEVPPAKRQDPGDMNLDPVKEPPRKDQTELVTMEHFDTQMSEMETRLTNNITASVTAGLRAIIDSSVKEALETIKKSVDEAIESNPTIKTHSEQLDSLETENILLKSRVTVMEGEQKKLQTKLNQIENRSLQNCIIIKGIKEDDWEKESSSREKIYKELASLVRTDQTFKDKNEEKKQRLKIAKRLEICSCKRLGKYNKDRPRPLSVELLRKEDIEYILANKPKLRKGIYMDREYPIEIERKRKILRPILTAAKKQKKYRKRCKMERDELVIKGKHYNVNTINTLPKSLKPDKVSSRCNDNVYGYFGELNPLSNFHRAPFTYDNVHYHCTEQLIQRKKAELFKDHTTVTKIMNAKTGHACKELGRQVSNFRQDKWSKRAKSLCQDGIKQKFLENEVPRRTLLSTKKKTIVECTKDSVWGCGKPLSDESCLDKTLWVDQGIMGEILETIRQNLQTSSMAYTTDDSSSSSSSDESSSESDIMSVNADADEEASSTTSSEVKPHHKDQSAHQMSTEEY